MMPKSLILNGFGSVVHFAISVCICGATFLLLARPAQAEEYEHQRKILGHQQCSDCHELPVEAWKNSAHSQRSLELIKSNLRAIRYADRLGLNASTLANGSSCVECHGTQQKIEHGRTKVMGGVSCESCHGAAGASSLSEGWYDYHSGEEELPEDSHGDLKKFLKDAGMARTDDLYLLAVRCYTCHSVSNEDVVRAGHVAGTHEFEFTSWFAGEVRHNFAPYTVYVEDEEENAAASNLWLANHEVENPRVRLRLMFVVGLMADLEVNLRNRAKATDLGTFATAAAGRSSAALTRLRQVAQRLNDQKMSNLINDLETARSLLFHPPRPNHKPVLLDAADLVGREGRRFIETYTGTDLTEIEALMSTEAKGQVFQP